MSLLTLMLGWIVDKRLVWKIAVTRGYVKVRPGKNMPKNRM